MGIGEVGERLRRSTVQVRDSGPGRQNTGSGVIWDNTGTVLTNAHVLGNRGFTVELWDGRTFQAELAERDTQMDLAKLRLPSITALTPVSVRASPVKPGEFVVAAGNPLGFTGALSTGTVRDVGPVRGLGRRRWVQSAIRLAPGNSGGPLADEAGRLVGINAMVIQGGIGLAIPSAAVSDFIKKGAAPRLGVTVRPVSLGRKGGVGLLLMDVEKGGAAENASLLTGDVLIGVNQAVFTSPYDLSDSLVEAPQAIIKLRFLRGDREREVAISLLERPDGKAA